MAGPLADALFFIAVVATVIAHWFIIRSTIRGMRAGVVRSSFAEWTWALLPAISVLVLLVFTWRAMHPGTITFQMPSRPMGAS